MTSLRKVAVGSIVVDFLFDRYCPVITLSDGYLRFESWIELDNNCIKQKFTPPYHDIITNFFRGLVSYKIVDASEENLSVSFVFENDAKLKISAFDPRLEAGALYTARGEFIF